MPSILLSFVGQQDPVSDQTREDGSIVSLIRHLLAQQQSIRQIVLLHTSGTQERAELTQAWLTDAPFALPAKAIALLPVDQGLSDDPVNVQLAVQAARRGLDHALALATPADILEFNASSGTPVMKSAWSILQAAGYAPKSRLWQVRNPKEQQPGQERVFQTNVQFLRQEFDLAVVKQQLQDYNYAGALTTLRVAGLATPILAALLTYGHCRLSLDFDRAQTAIAPVASTVGARWQSNIQSLRQRQPLALLREAYFSAVVELKNHNFSNFLVRVSQFQEKALRHLVHQALGDQPRLPNTYDETAIFWDTLAQVHPDLSQFLSTYQFRNRPLELSGFLNRPKMVAILHHRPAPVLEPLQTLNAHCDRRNQYIHQFEGISELADSADILKTMRQVLAHLGHTDVANPFNALNQEIVQQLSVTQPQTAG